MRVFVSLQWQILLVEINNDEMFTEMWLTEAFCFRVCLILKYCLIYWMAEFIFCRWQGWEGSVCFGFLHWFINLSSSFFSLKVSSYLCSIFCSLNGSSRLCSQHWAASLLEWLPRYLGFIPLRLVPRERLLG